MLLLPLIAMQFTETVNWTGSDFAFAGVLLVGTGLVLEGAMRTTTSTAYRAASAAALATTCLLIWANGAVGLIDAAGNTANLMYGGVLAVALIGALGARFSARGIAQTLFATALAQMAITTGAIIADIGGAASGWGALLLGNAFFAALWIGAALLFQRAAHEEENGSSRHAL
ncbi:hypothetical protein [Longimonas halophila]|nr:hypothetical protein [Longimonas halophila]